MTAPDGQSLRPAPPYGGDAGDGARPLSPRCPNTDPPGWLYWGYHCPQDKELRRQFGITCADYQEILETQDGRCGGCGGKPRQKALAVDHDHETAEIRGLLCTHCNQTLTRGLVRYVQDPPARKAGPFTIPPDRIEMYERRKQQRAVMDKRARARKRVEAKTPTTSTDAHAKAEAALAATKRS